jgi:hypothetical protein
MKMKQGYLRNGLIFILTACMLAVLISCGVGDGGSAAAGGGTNGGTTDGTTPPTPTATAAFIGLGTDTVTVKSDDSNYATITATVLDDKSAVIEDIFVTFSASCDPLSASCGTLSASSVKTNADGKASITFRSGTLDQSNRVITINATASGKSALTPIPIQVVGSTLTMTSSTTVDIPSDGTATSTLTVTAKNAGGVPVYNVPVTLSVTGTGNVTLSPTTGKTDQSGNISVTVTGALAGTATVKAEGLGAAAEYNYTVSGPAVGTFGITSPTVDPASSSTASTLTVEVTVPDATVTPNVTFATSLGSGSWDGPIDLIVTKVVDPATKKASAVLQSSRAGTARVQVYDSAAPSTKDFLDVVFYAPATEAAQVFLQSDVSVLGLSTGGIGKTTTLRATVWTSLATGNQPVGNAPVAFSIANPTGGGEFVSPVVAYTDAAGLATATFTSGTASSGAAGVTINAQVAGSGPPALTAPPISIVIGGTAGSVVIGMGSKITVLNTTTYALPMSVLVADSDGNPVPGAIVSLGLWPAQYSSGVWFLDASPTEGEPYAPYITGTFNNEDVNQNLIRDPGEDLNGDGSLTPPNSAAGTVPATVTTAANGVANFDLVYLKGSAVWIRDRIRATTLALGTETSSSITFTLPAEKTEYEAGDLPNSPYPIGLTVAATAGSTVSYLLPAFVPQYGTATYTTSSIYSTINSTARVYTFTAPAGVTAGTVFDDFITASRVGVNPRSATVWVRIVAQ